jgi:DNA repair protein RecO (recombination protein O)
MEDVRKIADQSAFVLHSYPWSETSLIVDLFTRDYGRMRTVAKGAQRPSSSFRGLLNPFSPLSVSLSGKGEVKTLTAATWLGFIPLPSKSLMSAFYLNELLIKLLAPQDPVPNLFARYFDTLQELSKSEFHGYILRYFEFDVLEAIGYGVGTSGFSSPWYGFYSGDLIAYERREDVRGTAVSGKVLQELAQKDLSSPEAERQARFFLRSMISYYLDGVTLNTPRVAVDIRGL